MRLRTLNTIQPTHSVVAVDLVLRLEHRIMQIKIVDSADPRNQHPREAGRDAVHERAADGAEVVLHRVAALDRLALGELGELVAAAHVHRLGLLDDEVGGEHRGRDLAAVGAVADEGAYVAGGGHGLLWVSLEGVFVGLMGVGLTKRHWTAPQKHVAVAVLLSLPPLTPSEGRGNLPELMLFGDSWGS
jgi:hypothetical protein